MLDLFQTLAKLSRFLNAALRRNRKIARGYAPNCCSAESYLRVQRSASVTGSPAAQISSRSVTERSPAFFTAANAGSAMAQCLIRLGGTLKISPEKPRTLVTVLLPWEANDASTSATGS